MDYLDSLYASYSAQAPAAAQTVQSGQTGTAQTAEVSFEELLSSLAGTSGQTGASQMQNALFAGIADGSITITDSGQFVSALISTMGNGDSFSSMDLLDNIDPGLLSPDTVTALLNLNQSSENDWLKKLLESMAASAGENENDDSQQAYYKAMAALAEVQKNTMFG